MKNDCTKTWKSAELHPLRVLSNCTYLFVISDLDISITYLDKFITALARNGKLVFVKLVRSKKITDQSKRALKKYVKFIFTKNNYFKLKVIFIYA